MSEPQPTRSPPERGDGLPGPAVRGRLLARSALTPGDERAMYALFLKAFEPISQEQFVADLDGKNWVVLLGGAGGAPLVGFSTMHFHQTVHRGRTIAVVYSGDTIVDSGVRDAAALSRTWIGAVNALRRAFAQGPVWWLLICSSHRTYHYLPLYWTRFYPRHDVDTPPEARELLDALASERFGSRYDLSSGVVRLEHPQVLRPELRGIADARLGDPHVACFARRNPGHERGDELACLTELSRDNLTPAGERMWDAGERAFASWRPGA